MRLRRSVAAAIVCLSMAGCVKVGMKAPLAEGKADHRLVEFFNQDINKRLKVHLKELMRIKVAVDRYKDDVEQYFGFEESYLTARESRCQGVHNTDLSGLYAEVVDWRFGMTEKSKQLSERADKLFSALEAEGWKMDKTDEEVGYSVIAPENREMVKTIMDLTTKLMGELALYEVNPVEKPECRKNEGLASEGDQTDKTKQDPLGLESEFVYESEGSRPKKETYAPKKP